MIIPNYKQCRIYCFHCCSFQCVAGEQIGRGGR